MRNIFTCTAVSTLFAALLTWPAQDGLAAEHGHVEYAHAAGVGSVHFAPRVVPVHPEHPVPGPVVRTEEHAVRAEEHVVRAEEHGAAVAAHAVYRNPYRDDYFRRFPPGYHPFILNGAQYYGYYSPPAGYQEVVLNGITYFLFGGIYYRPYMYGGQTVYVVVPAPV